MRDPRPGLAWSGRRIALRARYSQYMDSPAWSHRRKAWFDDWTAGHGGEPTCIICDEPWTLDHGQLHHRSYRRLGHETDRELLAVCARCHHRIHALLEGWPSWRRLDRAQATDMIVAQLRRQMQATHGS
jgi:5-methylcytosine-specific restriction endonuclease McrA